MAGELVVLRQAEQGMEQAGVAHVDLRRLHLTLLQVLEPRRQHPDQERPGEHVEIPARRALVRPERPGELGRVPDLPVVMGDHRPEAAQRRRRNRDAELRDVPFEKRPDEALAPQRRSGQVGREIRARKAAPQPERPPRGGARLAQIESRQIDQPDAAGERLRHARDQRRRCAAEQQEPGAPVRPVDQHAQRLEERRRALHLVDDHQPAEASERLLRRLETPAIDRGFQIEVRARRLARRDRPGQRRLAALPRAGQGDDRMDGERLPDAGRRRGPLDMHTGYCNP